ncbi:MAG: hypothetical protein AB2531_10215, partial [Candidatus Thiodiazotropha sp.]
MDIVNRLLFLLLMLVAANPVPADTPPDERALLQRLHNDKEVVLTQRRGLADTLDYMRTENDLFTTGSRDDRLITREQKELIWSTWVSLLDRLLILDSISQSYESYRNQPDEILRKTAFRTAYAAFLARYRYVLDFLQISERNPQIHILLNEPVPELGLKQGSYAKIKYHYLNVAIAAEFTRLALNYRLYGEEPGFPLNQGIEQDQGKSWNYGKGDGIRQTIKNGMQIVKDTSFKALFPIQKGVSEWMGDVRVIRPHQSLITIEQIRTLQPRLEPGDLLLERREWYLSNIGLPGFWPHAALYIGTPEQRRNYFQSPDIQAWARQQGIADGDFESLLKTRYPE